MGVYRIVTNVRCVTAEAAGEEEEDEETTTTTSTSTTTTAPIVEVPMVNNYNTEAVCDISGEWYAIGKDNRDRDAHYDRLSLPRCVPIQEWCPSPMDLRTYAKTFKTRDAPKG
jgi:hypothetical protein